MRKGGGFFRDASASRDAQWGIASEAIEKASRVMFDQFVTGGYLDRLASASADDWWDVTRTRVTEYVDRVEDSVERLDDNKK